MNIKKKKKSCLQGMLTLAWSANKLLTFGKGEYRIKPANKARQLLNTDFKGK